MRKFAKCSSRFGARRKEALGRVWTDEKDQSLVGQREPRSAYRNRVDRCSDADQRQRGGGNATPLQLRHPGRGLRGRAGDDH